MKVFLSWSGARSQAVAKALRDWLADILQDVDAWMSGKDISAGTRWGEQLVKELEETSYGVICLTPENTLSPWLLFEAGALSKSVESTRVAPYCFEINPLQIQLPLSQFQCVGADKEGTFKLVQSINELLEDRLSEERLTRSFERWWPDLEQAFKQIPKASGAKGMELIELKQIYCAYSEEFESLGAADDIQLLESYFPGKVLVRRNVHKLQLEEDLSTGRFEVLHLLMRTDPERGDLFFDKAGTQKVKLEGLRLLVEKSGAKLVFLATCDSTVLGSRLARSATVIAAYGEVGCSSMVDWARTFYSLLAKGRSLTDAYDQAQASSEVPMTLHFKNDAIFLISAPAQ